MIKINKLSELKDSDECKLLISALAILTSIDEQDIRDQKFGDRVHPDNALKRIVELANKIYFEEEWKQEQQILERDDKIKNLIN